jgi:pimeloyl-ACP methyl ester carboxylesterase
MTVATPHETTLSMPGGVRVSLKSSLPADRSAALPALVLLHGAGMDDRAWEPQLAALGTRGVLAIAPAFPGHGLSQGTALEQITALASWVLHLTDTLKLKRWALAGHSMGALVALEAAAQAQRRVAGLALVGAALRMKVNPELMTAAREDLLRAAAMIAKWGYGPAAQRDGRAELGRQRLAGSPPGVLAADLSACAGYEGASAAASRIACPAVVVAGAEDRMTNPKHGRALADALPRAEFVEIAGAGQHAVGGGPASNHDVLVQIAPTKEPAG